MKYICEEIDNRIYVRGKCCPEDKKVDYSNWIVVESNIDCGGVLIDENNQPIWEIVDGKIINNPLPLSEEQVKERVALEKKEIIRNQLVDKLIEDAVSNPNDNNLWIREILNGGRKIGSN